MKKSIVKLLCLATFVIVAQLSFAQQKNYNTKIQKAGKVTVKEGKVFIEKADTVYIEKRTDIVHLQTTSERDTAGIYITKYVFAPKDGSSTFPFDIVLKFDKPILRRYCISTLGLLGGGVGPMNIYCGDDWVHGTGNFTARGVTFTVRSEQPISRTEIYGAVKQ
jgi:hypothetical protein